MEIELVKIKRGIVKFEFYNVKKDREKKNLK